MTDKTNTTEEDLEILAELKEKLGNEEENVKKPPRFSQEYIDEKLRKTREHIDYKVGDWVETCHMLPGIVQKIENEYNYEKEYFEEGVEIFYPHYAFQYPCQYSGKSQCSIRHCGVHKITPEYACKLMALGEDMLKKLWEVIYTKEENTKSWEECVEEKYKEVYPEAN